MRRVGLVGSVSASRAVGRGFGPRQDHTKDHYNNGANCPRLDDDNGDGGGGDDDGDDHDDDDDDDDDYGDDEADVPHIRHRQRKRAAVGNRRCRTRPHNPPGSRYS